jgi:hypothetical protein
MGASSLVSLKNLLVSNNFCKVTILHLVVPLRDERGGTSRLVTCLILFRNVGRDLAHIDFLTLVSPWARSEAGASIRGVAMESGACTKLERGHDYMANKPEPCFSVDLPIRVFGVDDDDHVFSQIVHTRNISDHGATLAGLEEHLTAGDIIGVHFRDKKARCNVTWVVDASDAHKIDVGVELVEGQPHPWQKEVERERATEASQVSRIEPTKKEKRQFPRLRISFQIEIQVEQGDHPPMRTRTADISGSGCYIETMLPLPVGTISVITLWLNSERVRTTAIVRTCDGGVGMGIEFTGLDQTTQKRLQQHVESIAVESSEIGSGAEITDAPIRH